MISPEQKELKQEIIDMPVDLKHEFDQLFVEQKSEDGKEPCTNICAVNGSGRITNEHKEEKKLNISAQLLECKSEGLSQKMIKDEKSSLNWQKLSKQELSEVHRKVQNLFPLVSSKFLEKTKLDSPFDTLNNRKNDIVNLKRHTDNYENYEEELQEFDINLLYNDEDKDLLPDLCSKFVSSKHYEPYDMTKNVLDNKSSQKEEQKQFFIPNFPPTFYYHAYIEGIKQKKNLPPIRKMNMPNSNLYNLRDPPCLPSDIFYKEREFRTRDELVMTLKQYKQFGYSLIIEKSELKKGRFKLLCDRESKSKRQITIGDKINAYKNKCNAFVNIYQLKVKSLKLEHSHPPGGCGKGIHGSSCNEPWNKDYFDKGKRINNYRCFKVKSENNQNEEKGSLNETLPKRSYQNSNIYYTSNTPKYHLNRPNSSILPLKKFHKNHIYLNQNLNFTPNYYNYYYHSQPYIHPRYIKPLNYYSNMQLNNICSRSNQMPSQQNYYYNDYNYSYSTPLTTANSPYATISDAAYNILSSQNTPKYDNLDNGNNQYFVKSCGEPSTDPSLDLMGNCTEIGNRTNLTQFSNKTMSDSIAFNENQNIDSSSMMSNDTIEFKPELQDRNKMSYNTDSESCYMNINNSDKLNNVLSAQTVCINEGENRVFVENDLNISQKSSMTYKKPLSNITNLVLNVQQPKKRKYKTKKQQEILEEEIQFESIIEDKLDLLSQSEYNVNCQNLKPRSNKALDSFIMKDTKSNENVDKQEIKVEDEPISEEVEIENDEECVSQVSSIFDSNLCMKDDENSSLTNLDSMLKLSDDNSGVVQGTQISDKENGITIIDLTSIDDDTEYIM